MRCKRCGSKNPVGEMSYDVDGTSLICGSCSRKNKIESPFSIKKEEKKVKKIKYVCTSCNYKFSRDPTKHRVDICPYCSKEGHVEQYDEQGAEKLLREVSEMD